MKVKVHEFTMSDVDDFAIYVAEPLYKWEKSEQGQWVMANSVETPSWHSGWDQHTCSTRVIIVADLQEKDLTYFTLKWGIK
jgi:hypothetical protein